MDLQIKGKVALVTGGSRGLGKQCAISLVKEGVNVAICGRSKKTLDETVEELKSFEGSAIGIQADISISEDLNRIPSSVTSKLGPIDILVNNVGGALSREDIQKTSLEDFKATFDLNLFGSFALMKAVIPHMIEQKWGRIINIASIWGRENGGNISYMSAKAALIGATKNTAISLAKDGVLVNSIAPGSIEHPGGSWERFQNENPENVVENFIETHLPMGKFGWPEPVGDIVAFLASERASLITGACIVVDGGQSHSMI